MNRILLEIKGTQRFSRNKDITELSTFGTIRDDGKAYVIKYTEEKEPPEKPVNVIVRIHKDNNIVEMNRFGSSKGNLYIEKYKRNLCKYGTEYGEMFMGTYGRNIESDIGSGSGNFCFEYDIDFNGAFTSKNTVEMKYTVTN
ncbi:MAG: DUF1934 domain-containing protein [Clostridiales bacterium]|nr:DUF1934 domain-containing protein [Clostridiales bacterium]